MADTSIVYTGESSPESVAYKLFLHIAAAEKKFVVSSDRNNADRNWILDAYAECLLAVRNPSGRSRE